MRGSKYNPASFKISGIADVFEQRINFDEAIDSNNEIPKVSNLEGIFLCDPFFKDFTNSSAGDRAN